MGQMQKSSSITYTYIMLTPNTAELLLESVVFAMFWLIEVETGIVGRLYRLCSTYVENLILLTPNYIRDSIFKILCVFPNFSFDVGSSFCCLLWTLKACSTVRLQNQICTNNKRDASPNSSFGNLSLSGPIAINTLLHTWIIASRRHPQKLGHVRQSRQSNTVFPTGHEKVNR